MAVRSSTLKYNDARSTKIRIYSNVPTTMALIEIQHFILKKSVAVLIAESPPADNKSVM